MRTITPARKAFTLVELMVSTAIIGLIMLVLVAMTNQTSQTWRSTTEKIEKFQEARDGFESMTRHLAQATLNTNWDYLNAQGLPRPKLVGSSGFNSFVPVMYGRTADLRFLSGPMTTAKTGQPISYDGTASTTIWPTHGVFFQAPFGSVATNTYGIMNNLLNTWGYYIQASFDPTVPGFLTSLNNSLGNPIVRKRFRSRLMEFRQPSEQMSAYDPAGDLYPHWFTAALKSTNPPVRSLAENIIALVIMPKLSKSDEDALKVQINPPNPPWQLCPYYIYDSSTNIQNNFVAPPTVVANPGVTTTNNISAINPHNQLPPIVEVTMVALDERSAKRLDEKYGTGPNGTSQGSPYMGLDVAGGQVGVNFVNLFTDQSAGPGTSNTGIPLEGPVGPLNSTTPSDLNSLEQILIHEKLTYRIFTTNVTIRGAKWSRVQTK